MAKTYEIITDEKLLREFIEWLPDCAENEQFYCCLFMRKKYCPDVPWIKSDKGQLKRFTSKKEFLFDKIAQLECKVGAFRYGEHAVPQESLALYISPNPRDLWTATHKSIAHLANVILCGGKNSNPQQEVMSEIQKSIGNKKYIMFDIDSKDDKIIESCIKACDGYCDVTETRGGYHLFVHKDQVGKISNQTGWYLTIKKHADVSGDALTAPWGTYQGGHTVKPYYRINQNAYGNCKEESTKEEGSC